MITLETLVIGKPAMNIYMPLQEFPQEGDIFTIKNKNESLGNIGATAACLLSGWGASTHFTGVVGNDAYAEKIRDTFKEYKVNTHFLETNFETGTSANYMILNANTGVSSKIIYNNPEAQLTKYKYDFIPDYAIIDGTDFAGAHALLNNNANCKTLFYGRIGDRDSIAMSKRCTWVICTQAFAEVMGKMEVDDSAESYVNLYQKMVDIAGSSQYIIILNNHKILYSVDGKVKMLPEMKMNAVDYSSFDSIFVGAFLYAMENNMSLDDGIKLANTAGAISISKLGEVESIPTLDEVLDNSGLREKLTAYKKEVTTAPTSAAEVTPLNPGYTSNPQETVQGVSSPQVNGSSIVEQNTVVSPKPEVNNGMNVAFGTAPVVNSEPTPVASPTPMNGRQEQLSQQMMSSSQSFSQNQVMGQNGQIQ